MKLIFILIKKFVLLCFHFFIEVILLLYLILLYLIIKPIWYLIKNLFYIIYYFIRIPYKIICYIFLKIYNICKKIYNILYIFFCKPIKFIIRIIHFIIKCIMRIIHFIIIIIKSFMIIIIDLLKKNQNFEKFWFFFNKSKLIIQINIGYLDEDDLDDLENKINENLFDILLFNIKKFYENPKIFILNFLLSLSAIKEIYIFFEKKNKLNFVEYDTLYPNIIKLWFESFMLKMEIKSFFKRIFYFFLRFHIWFWREILWWILPTNIIEKIKKIILLFFFISPIIYILKIIISLYKKFINYLILVLNAIFIDLIFRNEEEKKKNYKTFINEFYFLFYNFWFETIEIYVKYYWHSFLYGDWFVNIVTFIIISPLRFGIYLWRNFVLFIIKIINKHESIDWHYNIWKRKTKYNIRFYYYRRKFRFIRNKLRGKLYFNFVIRYFKWYIRNLPRNLRKFYRYYKRWLKRWIRINPFWFIRVIWYYSKIIFEQFLKIYLAIFDTKGREMRINRLEMFIDLFPRIFPLRINIFFVSIWNFCIELKCKILELIYYIYFNKCIIYYTKLIFLINFKLKILTLYNILRKILIIILEYFLSINLVYCIRFLINILKKKYLLKIWENIIIKIKFNNAIYQKKHIIFIKNNILVFGHLFKWKFLNNYIQKDYKLEKNIDVNLIEFQFMTKNIKKIIKYFLIFYDFFKFIIISILLMYILWYIIKYTLIKYLLYIFSLLIPYP